MPPAEALPYDRWTPAQRDNFQTVIDRVRDRILPYTPENRRRLARALKLPPSLMRPGTTTLSHEAETDVLTYASLLHAIDTQLPSVAHECQGGFNRCVQRRAAACRQSHAGVVAGADARELMAEARRHGLVIPRREGVVRYGTARDLAAVLPYYLCFRRAAERYRGERPTRTDLPDEPASGEDDEEMGGEDDMRVAPAAAAASAPPVVVDPYQPVVSPGDWAEGTDETGDGAEGQGEGEGGGGTQWRLPAVPPSLRQELGRRQPPLPRPPVPPRPASSETTASVARLREVEARQRALGAIQTCRNDVKDQLRRDNTLKQALEKSSRVKTMDDIIVTKMISDYATYVLDQYDTFVRTSDDVSSSTGAAEERTQRYWTMEQTAGGAQGCPLFSAGIQRNLAKRERVIGIQTEGSDDGTPSVRTSAAKKPTVIDSTTRKNESWWQKLWHRGLQRRGGSWS